MARYDVVVIGAGLGGLTAGAILARAGRKVLVIERSNSVGGAASSYKSGDLFVEGSLHETSDPNDPRDPKHGALVRAGVLDAVKWIPGGGFYQARGGPLSEPFAMPDNFDAARRALTERFPQSRGGIEHVLDDMERLASAADIDLSPRATGRCRCRRNSNAFSAATKPSNARSPPTFLIITTIPPRCRGRSLRCRRAGFSSAADAMCRAARSGSPARWPAPSGRPAAR